jgi:RNA polymerase sigma-70 factor (ECF subfamily)
MVGSLSPVNCQSSERDPDALLVQQCQGAIAQGEDPGIAFRTLYQRYVGLVRGSLFRLSSDVDRLDDLVQEVFLRVWRGLPGFRGQSAFRTWLYRIVINVAQRRPRGLSVPWLEAQSTPPVWGELHHRDLVQRGLAALPPRQRALLVLHDLEDLPQAEVAEILGIRLGTVKAGVHQARQRLRQWLTDQGAEL